MRRLLAYVVAAVVTVPFLPDTAHAQVYPERMSITLKARALADAARAYQRRSRDDNREEQIELTTKVIKLGADGILALSNIAGDIAVTPGGGSGATIETLKTA